MWNTGEGPVVMHAMLLCCLLLLGSRPVATAAAALPPACPISGPVINVNPGVLNITAANTTDSAIYNLTAGTYFMPYTYIEAGAVICINGAGRDVTILTCDPIGYPHLILYRGATLFVSHISFEGNNTCGGMGTGGGEAGQLVTLAANSWRMTRIQGTALKFNEPVIATLHDTELLYNMGDNGAAMSVITERLQISASTITMTGVTRILSNVARDQGGGIFLKTDQDVANASMSLTLDGTVEISDNQAVVGGGIFAQGGVTVKVSGPSFLLSNNRAKTSNTSALRKALGGGLAVLNEHRVDGKIPTPDLVFKVSAAHAGALRMPLSVASPQLPTTVEFSSDVTRISQNIAEADADVARGAAVFVSVKRPAGDALVSFHKPAFIFNSTVRTQADGVGGAVAVEALGNGALATLNVAACVIFEHNSVLPANTGVNYTGAALGLSNNGAGADGSLERVVVNPAGRLLFGSNTVGNTTIESDVSIAAEGATIVCNATAVTRGSGIYTMCGDMCAASCNVTSGGDCACGSGNTLSCAAGPSLDCTTQPANLSNSGGWTCPSLAQNAVCNTICSAGFFGSPSATCNGGSWLVTGSCAGCPAPPPTGGSTLITGSSCTTAAQAGSYPIGTRCIPTCSPGSSGGLVICGQSGPATAPSWQVTGCVAGCNSTPAAIPGVVWQCKDAATVAGGPCSGVCSTASGFAGGPVTAFCAGPLWSNATTGSCTRIACIGNPPGSPANATFQCTSTPVGQACKATCAEGLSGGQSSECMADGSWTSLTGDSCVNCGASKPRLEVMGPPVSVPQGTTAVSATFTFTALHVSGPTTLAATLDGLTPCVAQPSQLIGPQERGAQVTATCQIATGITASLLHAITLTATYTGSSNCGSGSLPATATVTVFQPPTAAPTVVLSAGDAAPSACKAAVGKRTTAVAVFSYAVTPAAGTTGLVLADPVISASVPEASCTASRTGTMQAGQLTVACSGVFDNLSSLVISVTLKGYTPGSLEGSATASQTITFVCCTSGSVNGGGSGGSTAAGTIAQAVGTGDCLTCGTSPAAVEGVWLYGQLEAGVMRSGAVSAATCSSTGVEVGTISAVCDPNRARVLRVKVVNPPGTAAAKLQYLTRCNALDASSGAPCLEPNAPNTAAYTWRTALPGRDAFRVTTTPQGVIHEFAILQTSSDPNCLCSRFFFAIKQTGTFSLGPVSGTGACPFASAAAKAASKKAKKNKAKQQGRRHV